MSNAGDQTSKREDVLLLFDVDGTLTPSRQPIEEIIDKTLQNLKNRYTIGLVGGSDIAKIAEQILPPNLRNERVNIVEFCLKRYDYVFAENGLDAYKKGEFFCKQSLLNYLGEQKAQKLINFCLNYMSKLTLPVKRGNFVEFRTGLINICPVGRSCSQKERQEFNAYDRQHSIRKTFIEELEKQFGQDSEDPLGLVYAIGGEISFDVFPKGWDKTYCLNLIDKRHKKIHFFGDKTYKGGNDFEIFSDPRTIGHAVLSPQDTLAILKTL